MRPGNTLRPFEEMLQLWRAVGNIKSDLTGRIFQTQTSLQDERVIARPTFCMFWFFILSPCRQLVAELQNRIAEILQKLLVS